MRHLYSPLVYLLTPVLLLYFAARGLSDRGWFKRWGERFGGVQTLGQLHGIVIHCASVGEANAAAPLIRALQQRWPGYPLTVTCFTPTGSRRIRSLFGDSVHHVFLPIDLPGAGRRFLNALQPRLLVIMETEIWPNLYRQASKKNTPILVSNARLTPRSAKAWSRFPGPFRDALSRVSLVACQTEEDRQRFLALGADPDTTRVFGNLKFDIDLAPDLQARGRALRSQWGAERVVLVAGSTHEDDEAALFDAFGQIREKTPDALLVIVPRYPERFDRVTQAARSRGLSTTRLSEGDPDENTQCMVIDRMGVLLEYYAAADIAFIGGTIAEVGGHNPLEAAALGRPLVFGQNIGHMQALGESLLRAGAAIRVADSSELLAAWRSLLNDPEKRNEMGRAARLLVEQERGALERNLEGVRALLAAG